MLRSYLRLATLAVITVIGALLIIRCGGDGGDSPRVLEPLSYTGNTARVSVTLANAPTVVTNVLFGGSTASDMPSAVSITETKALSGEFSTGADQLITLFHFSLDKIIGNVIHGYQIPAAASISKTEYCETGYYTVQGTLNDISGTGTLTFDYYACLKQGVTFDGKMYFHVHYLDFYNLNATMEFVLMTVITSEFNVSMSGKILMDDSISGNSLSEQSTMNHVEKNNNTCRMYKFENYVMTTIIDDVFSSYSGGSISYTGAPVAIMYDSIYGSLTVDTNSPLLFSSTKRLYPDLGGQLVFSGNNSSIQLSVASPRHVKLELDLDAVAGYEVVRYVLWSELENTAMLNLVDTDRDAMHDSWETSFGLDPDIDDAADNLDSDGLTNLEEYEQGYDPSNPLSPTALVSR